MRVDEICVIIFANVVLLKCSNFVAYDFFLHKKTDLFFPLLGIIKWKCMLAVPVPGRYFYYTSLYTYVTIINEIENCFLL